MADRVVKVLTPADSYDLLSLDELKLALGVSLTDTSQDQSLQQYITRYSNVVATTCNRVFAYETVAEIWRGANVNNTNGMKRLFVTHYPINPIAIMTLESPNRHAARSLNLRRRGKVRQDRDASNLGRSDHDHLQRRV